MRLSLQLEFMNLENCHWLASWHFYFKLKGFLGKCYMYNSPMTIQYLLMITFKLSVCKLKKYYNSLCVCMCVFALFLRRGWKTALKSIFKEYNHIIPKYKLKRGILFLSWESLDTDIYIEPLYPS